MEKFRIQYENLFPAMIYLGAELSTEKNEYEKAISLYKEYLDTMKKSEGEYFLMDVFSGLARIYFKKDD